MSLLAVSPPDLDQTWVVQIMYRGTNEWVIYDICSGAMSLAIATWRFVLGQMNRYMLCRVVSPSGQIYGDEEAVMKTVALRLLFEGRFPWLST